MNNNMPLVCICIPNYNSEKTILQTLNSLINQTYQNIIIKIFDNASTDDSVKILMQYAKRYPNIFLFQNTTNIGAEANFTKCIENMEGKYSTIYHSDDIYLPTIVEEEVKALEKNNISAVFTRKKILGQYDNIEVDKTFPQELCVESLYTFSFKQIFGLILKYENFLTTPSVMAKTSVYKDKIKAWDASKFNTASDLDVWLRLSEIQNIGIISKELIHYRATPASFSYRRRFNHFEVSDFLKVIEFYLDKYPEFNKAYFDFYTLKDSNLIVRNKILNNIKADHSEIKLFKFSLLKLILTDKHKFKIYIFSIVYKIGLYFRANRLLSKIIKKRYNI